MRLEDLPLRLEQFEDRPVLHGCQVATIAAAGDKDDGFVTWIRASAWRGQGGMSHLLLLLRGAQSEELPQGLSKSRSAGCDNLDRFQGLDVARVARYDQAPEDLCVHKGRTETMSRWRACSQQARLGLAWP